MKNRLFIVIVAAMLFALSSTSCTKVFTDDDLDFLWRLDSVCYLSGTDFNGEPCEREEKSGIFYGFARDLVEICDHQLHGPIGIITRDGNTLEIDYSIYAGFADYDINGILNTLHNCGISELTSTFQIEELTSTTLTISDEYTRLSFTKW